MKPLRAIFDDSKKGGISKIKKKSYITIHIYINIYSMILIYYQYYIFY